MTDSTPIGRRLARFAAAMLVGAIMALGGMVLISGSVAALERTEVKRMVIEEALATRVPPSLALALAKVESDFMARALSPSARSRVTISVPVRASSTILVMRICTANSTPLHMFPTA